MKLKIVNANQLLKKFFRQKIIASQCLIINRSVSEEEYLPGAFGAKFFLCNYVNDVTNFFRVKQLLVKTIIFSPIKFIIY